MQRCLRHNHYEQESFSSFDSDITKNDRALLSKQPLKSKQYLSLQYSLLSQQNDSKQKQLQMISRVRQQIQQLRVRNNHVELENKKLHQNLEDEIKKSKLYKKQIKLLKSKVQILQNQIPDRQQACEINNDRWKDNFIDAFIDLIGKLQERDKVVIIKNQYNQKKKKIKAGWRYLKQILKQTQNNIQN